jgi:hypothetical protein
MVKDAHLGRLVLLLGEHPELFEAEVFAHFIMEVFGFIPRTFGIVR